MNPAGALLQEVGARRRKLIVVIGDVMLDRWIYGRTEPSQDGCHKFIQEATSETLGGAGNAMLSIGNWGVATELCGHWPNNRGTKTRYVDGGRIVFRHDCDEFAGENYYWARRSAAEWASQADGVLLSDYDKGFLTAGLIMEVADLCRGRRVPCVADVKRAPEYYHGCYTKANLDWYLKYGTASVVTRGADCPMVSANMVTSPRPGGEWRPVECVNHVGAGDCFAAHLVLALAYGFSLEDAAAIAHSAGRVYVQRPHRESPHPVPQDIVADMAFAYRDTISTSTP